jgi:hypothetical protein
MTIEIPIVNRSCENCGYCKYFNLYYNGCRECGDWHLVYSCSHGAGFSSNYDGDTEPEVPQCEHVKIKIGSKK